MPAIPEVDLTPYLQSPDSEQASAAIEQLSLACRTHGCAGVTGHGFDEKRLADAFAEINRFFQLPAEDKNRAPPAPNHGYASPGMEKVYEAHEVEDESRIKEKRKVIDLKVRKGSLSIYLSLMRAFEHAFVCCSCWERKFAY